MEHESFEDHEVAALMNDHFVNIKLDREERPDIDQIYMTVTQMITGHGGWPMTIVMTPEKKPFFAGTYFPKNSVPGRMGMMDLVPRIAEAWENEPDKIRDSSNHITDALQKGVESDMSNTDLDYAKIAQGAYTQLVARYDRVNGGFAKRPKFPTPHNMLFLMRYAFRTGEEFANTMVQKTLEEMRKGGIFDQIGYGFHRYSTDENWLLPHFEKMLYDQAMLLMAYTEAYQVSGNIFFKNTAEEIISYVFRDMTSPEGAFFSAEDADSEGEEGKFYVWSYNELVDVLGKDDALWVSQRFNVEAGGNFLEEASGHRTGDNIFHLKSLELEDGGRYEVVRQKLMARRSSRVRPLLDDKVLTDWNGLMVSALAKAGRAFGNPSYIAAAEKSVVFVREKLLDERADLKLLHRYREGEAAFDATLEDFAFLTMGLIDLYHATFNIDYFDLAKSLTDRMIKDFEDEENGGFFLTAEAVKDLIVRPKESYDGALPSGNSVAATNLIRLARMTGEQSYEEKARKIIANFGEVISKSPSSQTFMMTALEYLIHGGQEITLAGKSAKDLKSMQEVVGRTYLPHAVLLGITEEVAERLGQLSAFTATQTSEGEKTTAYVCKNHVCNQPVNTIEDLVVELQNSQ